MKKLILSMAAIAMMLTSCNEKDLAVGPQTATVKASFGFNQSSAMATSGNKIDKDAPSKVAGTMIYLQVPCNVTGFSVDAVADGIGSKTNNFYIGSPETADRTAPGAPAPTIFSLNDIFVGNNVFTTSLNLSESGTKGVAVNASQEFLLTDDEQAFAFERRTIEADFEIMSHTTESIAVAKDGSSETIALGNFFIKNGGAKISITGDATYKTRFIIQPEETRDNLAGSQALLNEVSVENPLRAVVEVGINSRKGLVINNNSLVGGSQRYIVTVEVAYDGVNYVHVDGSKSFMVYQRFCPDLSISLDDNYHLVVMSLGGVEITIGNFVYGSVGV